MTEEVKAPEVKVTPKVTPKLAPRPVRPKPAVMMGEKHEVEAKVVAATAPHAAAPHVHVEPSHEPRLPASVLAEQAAGRAAIAKNVKK